MSADVTEALNRAGLEGREIEFLSGDDVCSAMIELSKTINDLGARLEVAKMAYDSLTDRAIDYFTERGQQSVNRLGGTLYLAKEIWPKIVDDDLLEGVTDKEAIASARAEASERLVRTIADDPAIGFMAKRQVNHQTLRSWLLNDCERDENNDPVVPEHLRGVLTISVKHKVKVRKS